MRVFLIFILILLALSLGIYVGNTYQVDLLNITNLSWKELQEKILHSSHNAIPAVLVMCPASEVVRQHVGQSGPFTADGHSWSFTYLEWQPPEKIEFDQAFYYTESQTIDCNYIWTNPKAAGKLWLRIRLNIPANQSLKQVGSHWVKHDNLIICSSGTPDTCALEIITN